MLGEVMRAPPSKRSMHLTLSLVAAVANGRDRRLHRRSMRGVEGAMACR